MPVTGTPTEFAIMIVMTSEALGIGVVAIEERVASKTMMT